MCLPRTGLPDKSSPFNLDRIAYGSAARDIQTNILSSYCDKDRFKPGMRVRIGNDEGVMEKIDSISVAIRTADRLVLFPTKLLISERIEVLGERTEDVV